MEALRDASRPTAAQLIPESPYPPRCGNALRDAQQVELFRRAGFAVVIASLSIRRPAAPLPGEEAPGDVDVVFGEAELAPREPALGRALRKIGYVLGSDRNAFAWWTEPARPDQFFTGVIAEAQPAVVVVRSLFVHLIPAVRRVFAGRLVVDCHDADVHLAAEMIRTVRGLRRIGPWANLQAVRRACRRFLPMADEVWAVSAEDAARIRDDCPTANVLVVPSGLSEIPGAAPDPGRDDAAAMIANYGYGPNANGARWLLSEVWPTVRAARPSATLDLVGARMPVDVAEAAARTHGVHVHGEVESLDRLYAETGLVLAPIREGGGTRLKIIDAWRRGKAVLTTRKGVEGLPGDSGTTVRADAPGAYAEAMAELMADSARRLDVGRAGLACFRAELSWPAIFEVAVRTSAALAPSTPVGAT